MSLVPEADTDLYPGWLKSKKTINVECRDFSRQVNELGEALIAANDKFQSYHPDTHAKTIAQHNISILEDLMPKVTAVIETLACQGDNAGGNFDDDIEEWDTFGAQFCEAREALLEDMVRWVQSVKDSPVE